MKRRLLKRLCCAAAAFTAAAAGMRPAAAAEGRLYNQFDPYWDTVIMHSITGTESSMYTSACGVYSFCNAIYGLNSTEIDAIEFAEWAAGTGGYRPGNGGTYATILYPKLEAAWGERAHFKMLGYYDGGIRSTRLMNHLKSGGVAVIHVYNHFMAVTGYDEENDLYHVIESACSTARGLEGDSWVTAEKLSEGRTKSDWYALLQNTKAPEYSGVVTDHLHSASELSEFLLVSDIKGDFALGINDADGNRLETCYSRRAALSCEQPLQTALTEPGFYSCYASSYNSFGFIDSEPVTFQVYNTPPELSELTAAEGAMQAGEPVVFQVRGGTAESFVLEVRDAKNNRVYRCYQSGELGAWFGDTAAAEWLPEAPGEYKAHVVMYNDFGYKYSDSISLHVDGDVPVTLADDPDSAADAQTVLVPYGGAYGALPEHSRIGARFDGWFTEPENGEQISAQTVVDSSEAHSLYAHWTPYPAGDLNADMQADMRDAVLMSRLITEDAVLSADDTMLFCADTDGDGIIGISDLTALLHALSG